MSMHPHARDTLDDVMDRALCPLVRALMRAHAPPWACRAHRRGRQAPAPRCTPPRA